MTPYDAKQCCLAASFVGQWNCVGHTARHHDQFGRLIRYSISPKVVSLGQRVEENAGLFKSLELITLGLNS